MMTGDDRDTQSPLRLHRLAAVAAAAATIGLPLAALILLETGWAHYWGWGWALLHLAVTLVSCAAAYAWMRRWTND